jgi:hypothetical protein
MRRIQVLQKGLKDSHYKADGGEWAVDIEGAAGEVAVAKVLGMYWSGSVNTFKDGGDVGPYQIRHTDKESGRLIIRRENPPPAIYVFVTETIPTFRVVGWFDYSSVAVLRDEWLTDFGHAGPKVHAVPQSALRPIEELRDRKAYKPTA